MSLISMAASGLSNFASTVTNAVVNTVSSTISSYTQAFSTVTNTAASLVSSITNVSDTVTNLSSSLSNLSFSTLGNFLSAGNSRDNSIYDYLTNFKSGVMKSSRFRAEFNLPSGVMGTDGVEYVNGNAVYPWTKVNDLGFNANGSINVKCHQATFPSRALDIMQVKINGMNFKVPYGTSYDTITLTFYADGNMDTRDYFELWQSCVINVGNNTMNFYNEYVSDIKLYLQNDMGADTYGVILYECYPSSISMIDVAYASRSTPMAVQVIIGYKAWIPLSNSNTSSFARTV